MTEAGPTRVVCSGCGSEAPADEPFPFRCPNAGDGGDHVMTRRLDPARVAWPMGEAVEPGEAAGPGERNPFIRYRRLLHAYHLGRAHGLSDAAFVDLVRELDTAVSAVDHRLFGVTPFTASPSLSERLGVGPVWVKDETGNVSGSHKGRHLMGLAILLAVAERTGLAPSDHDRPLAIASCGNAALAAAVVARAADRPLDVFVPTWADPTVVRLLEVLAARIHVAPRQEGVPGDPAYHALQRAIGEGAVPFTCQGPDNGLTVEGGETLAYEVVDQARRAGAALDRVFVQVGGGALASAVVQGFRDARDLGALDRVPRLHAVQTAGGHPLERAYVRLVARLLERMGDDPAAAGSAAAAERIRSGLDGPGVRSELSAAAAHRGAFMWPWETEPKSAATGILDDETYDWLAVVRGMLDTGGYPVVVDESTVERANDLARDATGIDVDHTGSAGLAGLVELSGRGEVGRDEQAVVLFTGVRR